MENKSVIDAHNSKLLLEAIHCLISISNRIIIIITISHDYQLLVKYHKSTNLNGDVTLKKNLKFHFILMIISVQYQHLLDQND